MKKILLVGFLGLTYISNISASQHEIFQCTGYSVDELDTITQFFFGNEIEPREFDDYVDQLANYSTQEDMAIRAFLLEKRFDNFLNQYSADHGITSKIFYNDATRYAILHDQLQVKKLEAKKLHSCAHAVVEARQPLRGSVEKPLEPSSEKHSPDLLDFNDDSSVGMSSSNKKSRHG